MNAIASLKHFAMTTLRSPQPKWKLRGAVRAMLATGYDHETLVRELNRLRRNLAGQGREHEENALFDLLDALAGWNQASLDMDEGAANRPRGA